MKTDTTSTRQSRLSLLFLSLALCVLSAFAASAQQPAPAQTGKTRTHFTVDGNGWSADGSLVLNVHITAGGNTPLKLYTGDIDAPASVNDMGSKYEPFSMSGSYLVDTYSGKKISALQQLPPSPYFGPMAVATRIGPGNGVHLGVAFPPLPLPPVGKDGQPQPYKLVLYLPLDAPPVALTIPQKQ